MSNGDYQLSVQIIGVDELKQAISGVNQVAKKAISDAINKSAYDLQAKAVPKAPHDQGTLRGSIHADSAPGYLAKVVGSNIQAAVGTNVKYAHYQEKGGYGNRIVRRYTEPGTGKYYMRDAATETKPLFTEHLQFALKTIVSHLATKGAM
jgi:hypothetical protein